MARPTSSGHPSSNEWTVASKVDGCSRTDGTSSGSTLAGAFPALPTPPVGSMWGPSGESTMVNPSSSIRARSSSAVAKSLAFRRSSRSAASRRTSRGTSLTSGASERRAGRQGRPPASGLDRLLRQDSQAPGDRLEGVDGDRRGLLPQPPEDPFGDAEKPNVGDGGHRRRPRPAVDERDLAEEIAGPEDGFLLAPDGHAALPFEDQEQSDPVLALPGDHGAGLVPDLFRCLGDDGELPLGAVGEERDLGQHLRH